MSEVLAQIKEKVSYGLDPRIAQIKRLQAQINKLQIDAVKEAIDCLTVVNDAIKDIDAAVWAIIDNSLDELHHLNEDRRHERYTSDWINPWED